MTPYPLESLDAPPIASHEGNRALADQSRKRKETMRRFIEYSTKLIGAPFSSEEYAEHEPFWIAWVAGR